MRGTLSKTCTPRPELGIIPAYAGNTGVRQTGRPTDGDHPRVCGEHFRMPLRFGSVPGSSPRMRGTLRLTIFSEEIDGIIPAYAGNTFRRLVSMILNRDHPRVCGEHGECLAVFADSLGSSPRMRGTPSHYAGLGHGGGIIPAYAGNTAIAIESSQGRRDHPRVCGEHSATSINGFHNSGSSPRMRGTP